MAVASEIKEKAYPHCITLSKFPPTKLYSDALIGNIILRANSVQSFPIHSRWFDPYVRDANGIQGCSHT